MDRRSFSAPVPGSRTTGLVNCTVAVTVSPAFSGYVPVRPVAPVSATEATVAGCASMVTAMALL